jgi:hypothetical protein
MATPLLIVPERFRLGVEIDSLEVVEVVAPLGFDVLISVHQVRSFGDEHPPRPVGPGRGGIIAPPTRATEI